MTLLDEDESDFKSLLSDRTDLGPSELRDEPETLEEIQARYKEDDYGLSGLDDDSYDLSGSEGGVF